MVKDIRFLWLYKFPFGLEENFTKMETFPVQVIQNPENPRKEAWIEPSSKVLMAKKIPKTPAVHSSVFFQNDHWKKYEQKLFGESTWMEMEKRTKNPLQFQAGN